MRKIFLQKAMIHENHEITSKTGDLEARFNARKNIFKKIDGQAAPIILRRTNL